MRKLSLAFAFLLLTPAAFAQSHYPNPAYERVLIPVFYNGPGAHGAEWRTTVNLLDDTQSFDLARPVFEGNPICPFCGCSPDQRVEEGRVMSVCSLMSDPTGLMIWIPRNINDEETLHIQARARDVSRDAESAGAQLPVVRESDLFATPMMLLDVPIDPRFRVTLRLYDVYNSLTGMIVRIYDMDDYFNGRPVQPLVDTIITVVDPIVHIQPDPYPERPAFAVVGDLAAAFPQIAGKRAVAIEVIGTHLLITPPQHDRRFYALASVTNNETQEMTIIAPR